MTPEILVSALIASVIIGVIVAQNLVIARLRMLKSAVQADLTRAGLHIDALNKDLRVASLRISGLYKKIDDMTRSEREL